MKLGHISNNYISSSVHMNIVKFLSYKIEVSSQYVFIPIRTKKDSGKNFINEKNVEIKYSYCINPIMKYFPLIKVIYVSLIFLFNNYNKKFDHILAHNLWSDGMVALIYNFLFKTNYSLVVRNTDLNIFLPKLPHYRFIFYILIKRSNNLIFISKAYESMFKLKYPKLYNIAKNKSVIWNGIDKYWLDNKVSEQETRENNVCYVGRFTKSKNLISIFNCLKNLNQNINLNINLKIIGDRKELLLKLLKLDELPEWVHFYDKTYNKDRIRDIYRSSRILIMPSISETFGLTYIEALTQGCSVIHSKGQGIDGIFNEDYIIGVHPLNQKQMEDSIIYLLKTFPYGIPIKFIKDLDNLFDWEKVSTKYLEVLK